MTYTLAELNQLSQAAFVEALGSVFEDTPSIAAQAWYSRPFADRNQLYQQMIEILATMPPETQLALIRAHPDLGSRMKMADASVQEQASVGLDRLPTTEYEQFQQLNRAYTAKFGFPFIIAVREQTRASILENFQQRLQNSLEIEREQALREIVKIGRYRLFDRISH
jgi:2-oxo-4-hydroxy-4-carboxy-5-ureidoimidazoline decarboxylase